MIRQDGSKAMFLTSWPNGQLKFVEIIEQRKEISGPESSYYIRYENGRTDTTDEKFLFDVPQIVRDLELQVVGLMDDLDE